MKKIRDARVLAFLKRSGESSGKWESRGFFCQNPLGLRGRRNKDLINNESYAGRKEYSHSPFDERIGYVRLRHVFALRAMSGSAMSPLFELRQAPPYFCMNRNAKGVAPGGVGWLGTNATKAGSVRV